MPKKTYHGKRALLNLPGFESTAAIVAEIENTSTWKPGKDADGREIKKSWDAAPDYVLRISDCDRAISLELSFEEPDSAKNSLHKLDTLIDALTALRVGVAVEVARFTDRTKHLDDDA